MMPSILRKTAPEVDLAAAIHPLEGASADFDPLLEFLMIPREDQEVIDFVSEPLLERAIGVIYRPETERYSHYFSARLAEQFDAIIHFDESRAVEPLDRDPGWEKDELPNTFPSAL